MRCYLSSQKIILSSLSLVLISCTFSGCDLWGSITATKGTPTTQENYGLSAPETLETPAIQARGKILTFIDPDRVRKDKLDFDIDNDDAVNNIVDELKKDKKEDLFKRAVINDLKSERRKTSVDKKPWHIKNAFTYYEQSAKKGYREAQYNLAWLYLDGSRGVTTSRSKAIEEFEKAAEQGEINAIFNLGVIAFQDKDYEEAYKWFSIAKSQQDSEAGMLLQKVIALKNWTSTAKLEERTNNWFESHRHIVYSQPMSSQASNAEEQSTQVGEHNVLTSSES
jgi:tetratricopeptide (TPR) repeat protein